MWSFAIFVRWRRQRQRGWWWCCCCPFGASDFEWAYTPTSLLSLYLFLSLCYSLYFGTGLWNAFTSYYCRVLVFSHYKTYNNNHIQAPDYLTIIHRPYANTKDSYYLYFWTQDFRNKWISIKLRYYFSCLLHA